MTISHFLILCWTSTAAVVMFIAAAATDAKELTYPRVLDADTNPEITLDFDWLEIDPGFGGPPFQTRALGGSVPGPTIQLSAGTELKVKFRNQLTKQPDSFQSTDPRRWNSYTDPDTANLHFHGGHVSSTLPADDTTLIVPPGQEYDFRVPFPKDHSPGLHWVHPHHHGSTSLHLFGGAALALIVKDPPGFLPTEIEEAKEILMVFQDWDVEMAKVIAWQSGDALFQASLETIEGGRNIGQRFVTINGMYQPTITVDQGVWQRWRILYAGWQDLTLDLEAKNNEAGCEFHLLAKDGVYIRDYPRPIHTNMIPIPPGGRADLMVRCNSIGTTEFSAFSRSTLTLVTTNNNVSVENPQNNQGQNASLTPWQPEIIPEYLQSVLDIPATDGCHCEIKMKGYEDTARVNQKMYRSGNNFLHTTYLGAVVERELIGMDEHSYHQHIYPFQLVSGFEETEYFHYGDWHDTVLYRYQASSKKWLVRYRTADIPGKMMVHCHNTMHADWGMLAKEYIRAVDENGASCACDIHGPIDGLGIVDDVENDFVAGGVEKKVLTEDTSGAGSYNTILSVFTLAILVLYL